MADELGFHGNELVQFQTIFVVGNVVGLLPFIYLFPRVPMHILVPTLDLGELRLRLRIVSNNIG